MGIENLSLKRQQKEGNWGYYSKKGESPGGL